MYIAQQIVFLAGLAWFSWRDIKEQLLSLWQLGIWGGMGLLFWGILRPFSAAALLGGLVLGGIFLLGAYLSREALGKGDGLLICATMPYLGLWDGLRTLFLAFLLAAAGAVIYLVLHRGEKTDRKNLRMPFVPFMLVSQLIWTVSGWIISGLFPG